MRIVVDTNVMVSALLYPQRSLGTVIDFLKDGTFQLAYSPAILSEYLDVLRRLKISSAAIFEFKSLIEEKGAFIEAVPIAPSPISDPKDLMFLEVAVSGFARLIISGDRHLKDLKVYQGIPILTPRGFLDWVAEQKS